MFDKGAVEDANSLQGVFGVAQRTLAATAEGSAMGEATKGIMAKARMAAEMYQQQAAIESQVKQRCAACRLSMRLAPLPVPGPSGPKPF